MRSGLARWLRALMFSAAPGEREAGGSSQRDRPDRLEDTRRCYI